MTTEAHKPGCDALGGYGHGVGPCSCDAGSAEAKPDPKKCTARVDCDGGRITTESCITKKPLIDDGESSDGERDYYICPDCGKNITIDYREN